MVARSHKRKHYKRSKLHRGGARRKKGGISWLGALAPVAAVLGTAALAGTAAYKHHTNAEKMHVLNALAKRGKGVAHFMKRRKGRRGKGILGDILGTIAPIAVPLLINRALNGKR